MLKIRLKRTGRKRINTFRIVVIDSKKKRDSEAYVSDLGYYQPQFKNKMLKINLELYNQWIVNGAQPTKRVVKLAKLQNAKQS